MILSVTSETEEMKAGKTIRYRVDLANTGALDLENIRMTSSFSCPKITQQWEEAQGLTGKGSRAEVTELKAGEQRSFYILAPLLNEQEKDLEHKVDVYKRQIQQFSAGYCYGKVYYLMMVPVFSQYPSLA